MIFRRSIFVRMFTNLAIVLVLFGLIVVLGVQIVTSYGQSRMARDSLIESCERAERAYLEQNQHLLYEIAENTNTIIIITFVGGSVSTHSFDDFILTRGGFITSASGIDFYSEFVTNQDGNRVAEYMLGEKVTQSYTVHVRQSVQGRRAILSQNQSITRLFIASAFVLSLAWALIYSRIFTKPVLEMNNATKEMARLNFDHKIHINNVDEMGQLASSINDISRSLSGALGELNLKNNQLMEELERAKSLDEMRKRFVSDVSHELKTPLAIIQGYAEALSMSADKISDKRIADKTRKYSESIIDESQRMNKLVLDLLNLTTYQSGTYQLKREEVEISELIASVCAKVGQTKQASEVEISVQAAAHTLMLDPSRMEQVLTNLLSNAISHTADGKVLVTGSTVSGGYEIVMFNSGENIPDENLERIWTPFFRGDNSRSREGGRYGIGLSIVKALLDLHGAQFGARNTPLGVEFYVHLPTE